MDRPEGGSEAEAAIALEILGSLVADPRRRVVLDVLVSLDEAVGITDLAEELCTRMGHSETPDGEELSAAVRFLHHNDLPRFAELELIRYDPEALIVEPREGLEDLETMVSTITAIQNRTAIDTDGHASGC